MLFMWQLYTLLLLLLLSLSLEPWHIYNPEGILKIETKIQYCDYKASTFQFTQALPGAIEHISACFLLDELHLKWNDAKPQVKTETFD